VLLRFRSLVLPPQGGLRSRGFSVDWRPIFVPSGSLLELVIRGSIMYLLLLTGLRIFRREPGSMTTPDLLVVVIIADAAQNGMSGQYRSVTEAAVLVATVFGWNYFLDWLAFRFSWIHRILHGKALLLIRDGRMIRRNMDSEMLTNEDLLEQLRQQGVERVSQVRRCYVESDGHLSVLRYDNERPTRHKERVST